jgi:plasmid maintenance system antidote protein VapI
MPEIWLDLQSDYELRVARQTRRKTIDSVVRTRVA